MLEKALAISLGSYAELEHIEVSHLFHMLTGSNTLSYKVREDPAKNAKLFSIVKGCSGKNFITYCEQSVSNSQISRREETVFFLTGAKVINGKKFFIQEKKNYSSYATRARKKIESFGLSWRSLSRNSGVLRFSSSGSTITSASLGSRTPRAT